MKAATFTLSAEQVELYAEWTECVAFRFLDRGDGTVELHFMHCPHVNHQRTAIVRAWR